MDQHAAAENHMQEIVKKGYEENDYDRVFRIIGKTSLDPFEASFFSEVCDRIPSCKAKILDLGCGTGIPYDHYLAEKGHLLTGVDFCQKHIAQAIENVPSATFICGDFSKEVVAFPDESFDAVISLYAIFHLPREEHSALFERVYRYLKRGGVMLVTLGTSDSAYEENGDWLGARMIWSYYPPKEYEKMLAKIGFNILKTGYEGKPDDQEYHFWLLTEKS